FAAVCSVSSFFHRSINHPDPHSFPTRRSSDLAPVTSSAFDITPGTATQLVFTVQPSTTVAGAAISPAVQVSALDAANNVVPSFTGTVTVALGNNPGGSTLGGTTTVADVKSVV